MELLIVLLYIALACFILWAAIEVFTYYLYARDGFASSMMLNNVFSMFYNHYLTYDQITYQNRDNIGEWGYICKIKKYIFPSLFTYSIETRDRKFYGVIIFSKAHRIIKRKFKELKNENISETTA